MARKKIDTDEDLGQTRHGSQGGNTEPDDTGDRESDEDEPDAGLRDRERQ